MKQTGILRVKLTGLINTFSRFVLSTVFLFITTVIMILAINQDQDIYPKLVATLVVGTFMGLVSQVLYERFFKRTEYRILFMGITVILMVVYYLLIMNVEYMNNSILIRTVVILFALFIAFLWIPVIKSEHNFNESFVATFKAFFSAAFFFTILFLGVLVIIATTNRLIVSVDDKLIAYAADIIFVLLGPLYFLSLIPVFPPADIRDESEKDAYRKAIRMAKFLETLISYVIIPITVVFTVILLLYLIINITGSFWTDNLLEPMLVTYSILVIVVYLLASQIDNMVAKAFRKIFPKVLVPIVMFQTISSILRIGELGITHGRYYVILFGVFATVSGLLFCFLPTRKNGIIAPILLVLCLLSILPPLDAFTISRINQTKRLEKVLKDNSMLENNKIIPKADISKEDKQTIITSVRYLDSMDYVGDISWLPDQVESYNIEKVFGFSEYGPIDKGFDLYFSRAYEPIPISGYDYMMQASIYRSGEEMQLASFELEGMNYVILNHAISREDWSLVIKEKDGAELIRYPMIEIFDDLRTKDTMDNELSTSEAIYTKENDQAILTLVIESATISEWEEGKGETAQAYVLLKIK